MNGEEFLPGFLLSLAMGGLLGAIYDGFRILYILLDGGKRQRFLFDVLFMCAASVLTFIAALAAEKGQLRFYMIAGEGIGMCLWAMTFGELTIWAAGVLRSLLRAFNKLLRRMFFPIIRFFRKKMCELVKKRRCKSKNKCSNRKKSLETDGESSV